jgi:hypothetical protein
VRWHLGGSCKYAQHPNGAVNSTTFYPFERREWRQLPDQENIGLQMASSTSCSDIKCFHLLALSKDHSLMTPSLATPSCPGRDLLRASLAPAATISETIHQSSRSETSVRTNKSHTLIFSGAHGWKRPCATGNSAIHDVGGPGCCLHLDLSLLPFMAARESSLIACFSLYHS